MSEAPTWEEFRDELATRLLGIAGQLKYSNEAIECATTMLRATVDGIADELPPLAVCRAGEPLLAACKKLRRADFPEREQPLWEEIQAAIARAEPPTGKKHKDKTKQLFNDCGKDGK